MLSPLKIIRPKVLTARLPRPTVLAAVVVALGLSACSSVPDAVNPVEWGKSISNTFSGNGDQPADQNAEPVQGADAPAPGDGGLVADRANARYTDEDIYQQGPATSPLQPEPEAPPAPEPAPAPSVQSAPAPAPVQTADTKFQPAAPSKPAPPPGQPLEPVRVQPMPDAPPPSTTAVPNPVSPETGARPAQVAQAAPAPLPTDMGMGMSGDGFETVVIDGDGVASTRQDFGELAPLDPRNFGSGQPARQPAPQPMAEGDGGMVAPALSQGGAVTQGEVRGQLLRPDAPLYQAYALEQFDPMATGVSYHVGNVTFATGSSAIGPAGRKLLREAAAMAREYGGTIRVVGHASSRTRDMDLDRHNMVNYTVSLERANAAVDALLAEGLPAERIYAGAMGDVEPMYYEVMPAGESGNRRVEIYLDY